MGTGASACRRVANYLHLVAASEIGFNGKVGRGSLGACHRKGTKIGRGAPDNNFNVWLAVRGKSRAGLRLVIGTGGVADS